MKIRKPIAIVPVMLILILIVSALWGCESVRYYSQAVSGHLGLLNQRRPIREILEDADTPNHLKLRLLLVLSLRDFAGGKLALPVDNNYMSYADLKRPFVVWSVYAAKEFSLEPRKWCFPIVGCMVYKGYFAESNADHYADQLEKEGYDVYVGGATAYSTLGWFDDPVLNTFIYKSDTKLAAILFHELAHKRLYIKDDTKFNESLANAVVHEGVRRWLVEKDDPEAVEKYQKALRRHEEVTGLLRHYRKKLKNLYATDIVDEIKREQKQVLFAQLVAEYENLKAGWPDCAGYDEWFYNDLNNAKLISLATYNDYIPGFLRILHGQDGDFERFFKKCEELAKKTKDDRKRILTEK